MGIIKATTGAIGGALADQWLEVIEAENMGQTTVMAPGVLVNRKDKKSQKSPSNIITDGSTIMVGPRQFMILSDGGRVIDYSAEEGYYTVKNDNAPSLFNGNFGDAVTEAFSRIKYGGTSPQKQQVFYINTQEIKNIPFGTPNPINYYDNFYNAELFLRAHGYFSIRIVNPLLFFAEVVSRNSTRVDFNDINSLYISEFLTALQSSLNQMSVDGIRISHVTSKASDLADYMSDILDDKWAKNRGMQIESVGISSIGYDEESKKLINMRNQGAMLSDASVREGYVQGSVARGIESAGSNPAGAGQSFMGIGMAMNQGGGYMAEVSKSNKEQMQAQQTQQAQQVQQAQPTESTWICENCNNNSTGNFCSNCGTKKPEAIFCSNCGNKVENANFCPNCGNKL